MIAEAIHAIAAEIERAAGSRARLSFLADRAAGMLRAKVALRGAQCGARVYVGGPVRVASGGEIAIGSRVILFGGILPTELRCARGARLHIGEACVLNYGVSIDARREVRLGRRCQIGSMVRIVDAGPRGALPIVIEDDVWIAHGATIEPGVTLGAGSVVSAGSVVTASVAPLSLAIGNPARCVSLELIGASR